MSRGNQRLRQENIDRKKWENELYQLSKPQPWEIELQKRGIDNLPRSTQAEDFLAQEKQRENRENALRQKAIWAENEKAYAEAQLKAHVDAENKALEERVEEKMDIDGGKSRKRKTNRRKRKNKVTRKNKKRRARY